MEIVTLVLSFVAVFALLLAVILDSTVLSAVGLGLLLIIIVLIWIGLKYWGWESGDSPGGFGGP